MAQQSRQTVVRSRLPRLEKSLPNIMCISGVREIACMEAEDSTNLQQSHGNLTKALQAERNSVKQLRRQMSVQLKQVKEEEHQKSTLLINDLKSRQRAEKVRELEQQRENLHKKFESEHRKLSKLKDSHIHKLQNDLKKIRDEVELMSPSTTKTSTNQHGLSSHMTRDTFDCERSKLHKEIQDLQTNKKSLETELTTLREQDKRLNYAAKKHKEDHAAQIIRIKKEADVEVRKLLEELRTKDRHIAQLKSDTSGPEHNRKSVHITHMPHDRKSKHITQTTSPRPEGGVMTDLPGKPPPLGSVVWTPKTSDLNSKLSKTEDRCRVLQEEKQKLQVRLKEAERKHRPLLEKNKKFLEKNMELSALNRSLEDKVREMTEDTEKMKCELEKKDKMIERQTCGAATGEQENQTAESQELQVLRQQSIENDKTIAALKLACAEKDRRIELILHRKRKQRSSKVQNKNLKNAKTCSDPMLTAAGIKETYFGYDEADSVADDSEMSLSICSSVDMLDDEDVFEEFTREEFEANYQRLVKEHLELEKSVSILTANQNASVESQRETKLRSQLESDLTDAQNRVKDLEKLVKSQGQIPKSIIIEDTGWIEEKEKLNKTIRSLKHKLLERDDAERRQNFQIEELQEQNEVLEFRTLELEEQCDKLSEHLNSSVTFSTDLDLTDSGILQMYAEERGHLEVTLSDLKENINLLKQSHVAELSTDEKVTLVQTVALLSVSDRKLNDLSNTISALKTRIRVLEEEKARILSQEQGITTDLVLEYEATRNQLVELQLKCDELESECDVLKKAEAINSYKHTHFEKIESTYTNEIAQLKRRLSSASEGRGYENEIFQDKLLQLKVAEQKLSAYSRENETLQTTISELQRECVDLHEQLTLQQDTLSLTESDKDTMTQHHIQENNKMADDPEEQGSEDSLQQNKMEDLILTNQNLQQHNHDLKTSNESLECSLKEYISANHMLEKEVVDLKVTTDNITASERSLREDNAQLHHVIQDLSDTSRQVEDELESRQNELDTCQDKYRELQAQEAELKHLHKEKCEQLKVTSLELISSETKCEEYRVKCDELSDLQDRYVILQHEFSAMQHDQANSVNINGANIVNKDSAITGAIHTESDVTSCNECGTQTSLDSNTWNLDASKLEELESEMLDLVNIISHKDKSHSEETHKVKLEVSDLKNEIEEKESLIIESMETINLLQDRIKRHETWKSGAEEKMSEVDALQETLIDMEQLNSQLKQRLKQKEEELAEFSMQLDDKEILIHDLNDSFKQLKTSGNNSMQRGDDEVIEELVGREKQLLEELAERDQEVTSLQAQVISLEKNDQESAKKILELLDAKSQLSSRLRQLETEGHLVSESETHEWRTEVDELDKGKVKLRDKVHELQELLQEEALRTTELEQKLSELEQTRTSVATVTTTTSPLVTTSPKLEDGKVLAFKLESCDHSSHDPDILVRERGHSEGHDTGLEISTLQDKVKELEQQLEMAAEEVRTSHEELITLDDEQSRRIEGLTDQIYSMEENEKRLNETVLELEDIEKELRNKVELYEKSPLGKTLQQLDDIDQVYNHQMKKLTTSEQNLKDKLEQMALNEQILRERVDELEEKLDAYEKQDSAERDANNVKVGQLEETNRELAEKEAKLLEEVYKMKMENEELQEHVDQLMEERSSQNASPPAENSNNPSKHALNTQLQENIKKLQAENEQLKDDLLKSKLEAIKSLQDSGDFPEGYNSLGDLYDRLKLLENKEVGLKDELSQLQSDNCDILAENEALKQEISSDKPIESPHLEQNITDKLEILQNAEEKLMEQVGVLEDENDQLKHQVERLSERMANSSPGGPEELQLKVGQMRKREEGLMEIIAQMKRREAGTPDGGAGIQDSPHTGEEVSEADRHELDQLREKVDMLLDSEEKLMDTLQEKEELGESLHTQLGEVRNQLASETSELEEVRNQLNAQASDIEEYQSQLNDYKTQLSEQTAAVKEYRDQLDEKTAELANYRNQLDDKTAEVVDYRNQLIVQVSDRAEVDEKLKRLQILEEMQHGNNKLQEIAQQRIHELEANEKDLKERLNSLEKQTDIDSDSEETNASKKNHYLQRQLTELENVVDEYEGQIQQDKNHLENMTLKLNEHEDGEKALKTTINELQVKNGELSATIERLQRNSSDCDNQDKHDSPPVVEEVLIQSESSQSELALRHLGTYLSSQESPPGSTSPLDTVTMETLRAYSPVDMANVDKMSRDEMASKIRELQELENYHRSKILEMKDHLTYFRRAVEVVIVAMENDAEVPVLKMRPSSSDTGFQEQVSDLVKTEVKLKIKVLEMEKRETTMRRKLTEAESVLKEVRLEHREELDQLTDKLNQVARSEAKLRSSLEYGQPGNESQALLRIHQLEDTVFDLEASEVKLKREITDLKARELELKCQLEDLETHPGTPFNTSIRRSQEDKDKYWDLLGQIQTLESSEKDLKDRIEQLRKEDPEALIQRISDLERHEKGLKLKLELIEQQEPSFLETIDLSMLDSPETILKQRVRELETMERHLKTQLGELERDREELHEIARKDKNVIHDMNVQIRELQLAEKNLRESLNRYDLEDNKLHSNLDDLTDENEELREELQKLQQRERSMSVQLQKVQFQETDLSLQLENTREDMSLAQSKLKKKVTDLEADKRQLHEKCDELTDKLGDLEGVEINLKQKLRHLENNETQLKARVQDLENAESSSSSRITDLESINEVLSEKVRRVEEEKSGMIYDVSSLTFSKEEYEHENERLQTQVKSLRSRLDDLEMRKSAMQQRMDDYNSNEVQMHAKLQDLERCDKEWRDRIQFLEHNEQKLRERIHELEDSMNNAENLFNQSGDFESEISTLQNVVEFHRQQLSLTEEENGKLKSKISQYEYAKANDQMAMVPSAELADLRSQVSLLETAEDQIDRLLDQEKMLKEAIDQLREGKDACGHEYELNELKQKADLYNNIVKERDGIQRILTSTKKAQALMRTNYDDTKKQLADLQAKVQNGSQSVALLQNGSQSVKQTSSKALQVKLTEEYTLKNLSSGEIHYAMETNGEFSVALKHLGTRHPEAYEDFVRLLQPQRNLSMVKVNSTTGSQPQVNGHHDNMEDSGPQETKLWKAVEGRRSHEVSDEETDHPHWSTVERNMGDTEEMTVTVNFESELEGHIDGGQGQLRRGVSRSTESVQSTGSQNSLPPPLPNQAPPSVRRSQSPGNDSYYLPSADEASEIMDEDDLSPKHASRKHRRRPANQTRAGDLRAKSADRDSDFSEMTAPLSHGRVKVATRSLDSIPDDSGYQEVDQQVLRNKITYLEAELEKRDRQVLNNEGSGPTDEQTLKSKVDSLERQLETQIRRNKDAQIEVGTRNREVDTLKMKIELLEKTRKKTFGVDSSPITLSLKPTSFNQPITSSFSQPITSSVFNNNMDEVTEPTELKSHIERKERELKAKYEHVTSRNHDLEESDLHKHDLENSLDKLQSQLKDLERVDLERETYEAKVKVMEQEVKHMAALEKELSKENIKLRHLVDGLERDNGRYKEMDEQYRVVTQQYRAMEEVKQKSQLMVTPLRARVLRLTQKCRHKNTLINRLAQQLQRYEGGSQLLSEADQSVTGDEDLCRPLSPLTSKTITDLEKELKASHLPSISTSVRSTPRLHSDKDLLRSSLESSTGSDTDDLLDPNLINGFKTDRKSTSVQRSEHSVITSPLNGANSQQPIKSLQGANHVTDSIDEKLRLVNPPQLCYRPVTLLDSAPLSTHHHSNSDKPLSPRAPAGSVTAISYKAVKENDPNVQSRRHAFREGDVLKPLAAGFISLPTSHRNTPIQEVGHRPVSTPPLAASVDSASPEPPSRFRVQRIVGKDGVLLSWEPPVLDELARSNGTSVKGYKITIDGATSQHLPSPFMTKALLEHLNLHHTHVFSIKTLAQHTASVPVETAFTDVIAMDDGEQSLSDYSLGGSSSGGAAERRVFLAVYDFAGTDAAQEVSFKTGDVVVCYGKQRPDGYYLGKVHGKKGLVPASFIEEVAVIASRAKRSHSSGSSILSPRQPPSTASSSHDNQPHPPPRVNRVAKLQQSSSHAPAVK